MKKTRRDFIEDGLLLAAGASLTEMAAACSLFDDKEMRIGTLSDFEKQGILKATFNRKEIMVTREKDDLVIFNLQCRHKRCTVEWQPDRKQFLCPCHDGLYDAKGNVLDGPPKGPLYRFKPEIRGQEIWVINEILEQI